MLPDQLSSSSTLIPAEGNGCWAGRHIGSPFCVDTKTSHVLLRCCLTPELLQHFHGFGYTDFIQLIPSLLVAETKTHKII